MTSELFKPGAESWDNAKIPRGNALSKLLSDGYRIAEEILVKHVLEKHTEQDYLFFPICFLYRHSVELYLKQIIYYGTLLTHNREYFPKGHRILKLWGEAKFIIEDVWPNEDKCFVERYEKVLKEIHEIDPSSQSFRYHIDSNKMSNLLPSNFSMVSIKNISYAISETLEFLENCVCGLQCHLNEVQSNACHNMEL